MLGLGTLLKHEMKAVGRRVLPFFAGLLIISLIFGISVYAMGNSSPLGEIFGGLMGVLYVAAGFAVMANSFIVLIQRYYGSLLGNEGYLNLTLPVSTSAHIANKTISASIWAVLSIAVGALSVLIALMFMVAPSELWGEFTAALSEITDFVGGAKVALIILEVIVMLFIVFAEAALKIYAAISLGQLWSNHRVLGAIGSYIGFCIVETIIAGIFEKILPLDGLYTVDATPFAIFQIEMLLTFAVVAIAGVVYWFVTNRLVSRRLNLQ